MTAPDPQQITNLITRLKALQVDAQNLISAGFVKNAEGQKAFVLTYLRLHDSVEQLLHDASVPIANLEQLQSSRHRSLVAEQVPPQSLYREVAGETTIVQRVLDDLLAALSAAPPVGSVTTPVGITIRSDAGKVYTYQPAEILGRSRFSQVYSGRDEAGGQVAIKRLEIRNDSARHRNSDQQQAERELQIAQQLARAANSHIMPIIDAAHLDDELLIVMPRADYSLADAIQGRQWLPTDAGIKDLLRQIASAMQELANPGIIHRDIKPSNILWYGARWRLADFGISRIMSAVTATYTFRGTGTLEYLAPEAWNFGPQTVASDLYALGCVAYEATTGQKAFDGDGDVLLQLHTTHIPNLPIDTDLVLAKVINLLLAKSPDQRPPDARRVLELLAPRDGLKEGQRALQRLSAAAALRALERAGQDATLIQHHERRDRARTALGALWRDLTDEVRQAVPDAQSTEEGDNRTLTVADTRLRIRLDDAPQAYPGQVLLTAEIYIDSVGNAQPRLVANLVCFWQNDRPEWQLAQFDWKPIAGLELPANVRNRSSGLPASAAYQPWNSPDSTGGATIATAVRADPTAIIDLIAREAEPAE